MTPAGSYPGGNRLAAATAHIVCRDDVRGNEDLRRQVGDMAYYHLLAYVTAGRHLRMEIQVMLGDCEHIVFVESFEELQDTVCEMLPKLAEVG